MQEYFIPAFFVLIMVLFLMLVFAIRRQQAKVDAVRAKYYRKRYMQAQAKAEQNKTSHGFQVLYERRAGDDRRVRSDQGAVSVPRQNLGRRKEDLNLAG